MASDAQRIRDAAARYGRSLDAVAARYTNPVTGKRLSGEALILKTIKGESGGRRDAVSSAGARAWAQFMPGTRASFIKSFGVDPWRSPEEAVHALTLHMRGKGGHATGLEGYNPGGGQGYVNYILGQQVGSGRGSAPRGRSSGGRVVASTGGGRATLGTTSGSSGSSSPASPASPFSPGPLGSGLALKLEQAPSISTAGPSIPSRLRPRYYQDVPSFGPPIPPPDPSLPDASGQAVSFGEPAAPSSSGSGASSGSSVPRRGGAPSAAPSAGGRSGKVVFAPTADRPGARTQPIVKNFLSRISALSGRTVSVGTGTNHNQFVAGSRNESEHWIGHAADLPQPVDSKQGDLVAAHALQAAGVPWARALSMAQKGGVFNVTPTSGPFKGHRVQVLWKTMVGGNHHNHVHVGVR